MSVCVYIYAYMHICVCIYVCTCAYVKAHSRQGSTVYIASMAEKRINA